MPPTGKVPRTHLTHRELVERWHAIHADREAGLTARQSALKWGVGRPRIAQILAQKSPPLPPGHPRKKPEPARDQAPETA